MRNGDGSEILSIIQYKYLNGIANSCDFPQNYSGFLGVMTSFGFNTLKPQKNKRGYNSDMTSPISVLKLG